VTIDPTRLADLDLYDHEAADAHDRLELLQYLITLGACEEDLLAYRDQLAGLASVLALRGGRALTLAEVVERSGAPRRNCAGSTAPPAFPIPDPRTVSSASSSATCSDSSPLPRPCSERKPSCSSSE
jgi:hypothetical protein